MPRPQFFRELVDESLSGKRSDSVSDKLMDRAIPYVVALQEAAGMDLISDGEWRRKSYVGVVAESYTGFETEKRIVGTHRHSAYVGYTVTGKVFPSNPGVFARESIFLQSFTKKPIRIALPTPFLIASRTWDLQKSSKHYPAKLDLVRSLIPVVREELILLRDTGVQFVQFDDPDMGPDKEDLQLAIDSLNEVVDGVDGIHLSMHLCGRRQPVLNQPGYSSLLPEITNLLFDQLMFEFLDPNEDDLSMLSKIPEKFEIGVGCIAAREPNLETPSEIVDRVKQILKIVSPERIALHPDCGFSPGTYFEIPLDEIYDKMRNEVLAAEILRQEFS